MCLVDKYEYCAKICIPLWYVSERWQFFITFADDVILSVPGNTMPAKYRCPYCYALFQTLITIIEHGIGHHKDKNLKYQRGHLDFVSGNFVYHQINYGVKPDDVLASDQIIIPIEKDESVFLSCNSDRDDMGDGDAGM